MAEKKPDEPQFHPEYPFPAPPMSDQPWSDEVEDEKPAKQEKE